MTLPMFLILSNFNADLASVARVAADVYIYPPSFNIRSYLLLKTISGLHNKRDNYLGSKKLCGFVCFEFLHERISFVCNRRSLSI